MTNYFTQANSNWKEIVKKAAMTEANDYDIEKAFGDQASMYVENKVGDLMKDEHRVGFEIVKKNDDNTRMVGVFAFKVDKSLIFAPVFFINGEIKGPLLYRCDTKTFVPATKEWASYLIEAMDRSEGKGRSRERRGEAPARVDMDRMAFRDRAMGKSASGTIQEGNRMAPVKKIKVDLKTIKEKQEIDLKSLDTKKGEQPSTQSTESSIKQAAAEEFGSDIEAGILASVARNAGILSSGRSVDGSLKEMLNEPYFGKRAAKAIIKAASSSEEFASQLVRLYGSPDNLFPERYIVEDDMLSKQASAGGGLTIHYDLDELSGLEKSAAARVKKNYFRDGFFITDERPQDGLSVVDETYGHEITNPSEAGMYSIVLNDGTFLDDAFVIPVGQLDLHPDEEGLFKRRVVFHNSSDNPNAPSKTRVMVYKGGKVYFTQSDKLWAIHTGKASDIDGQEPAAGSVYYMATDDGHAFGPVKVDKVKDVDGVKSLIVDSSCYRSDFDKSMFYFHHNAPTANLIYNKTVPRTDMSKGIIGGDTKFIKIVTSTARYDDGAIRHNALNFKELFEEVKPAKRFDEFVYDQYKMDKVKVKCCGCDECSKSASFKIEALGKESEPMNKVVMMVKLARDLGIHASTAADILDTAEETEGKPVEFMLGLNKEATRLRLVDRPKFDEDFDSEFGVPVQKVKSYRLRVEGDQQMPQPSHIGDALDPTSPTGLPDSTVATSEPEDLQSLADLYKVPHIFEHGVIGTLADTFNALALLDKYIPKLEDGVDALGRIKFLLHWCPNDFERGYGSDDMVNLESEVDSNFVAQGALLLKLLKKSDKMRKNDSDTTWSNK